MTYNGKQIAKFYVDFIVEFENIPVKILIELKVAEEFHKKFFDQVVTYLTANNLELGLLAIFTRKNVLVKRIINQEKQVSA